MKTEAIVFAEENTVCVNHVKMPLPGSGEVQIQTLYSTVSCGTESWILQNLFTWQPTIYPCVPGYQRTGKIVEIGQGVRDWSIGDRVMATTGCWRGSVSPMSGAHIAIGNTSVKELYHIPENVDSLDTSATVVAQVGYNAASRVIGLHGQWVAIFGDGLIGQFAAQAVRARNMHVVLVGHRAKRLKLAAKYSADAVVNSNSEKVVETVRNAIGSEYVIAVIDTVQNIKVQTEYLPLLLHGTGQIVYSGFSPEKAWANMAELQKMELTAHFVSGWNRQRMETTLTMMAEGLIKVKPLITHLVSYQRAPEMWKMILNKNESFLGISFSW